MSITKVILFLVAFFSALSIALYGSNPEKAFYVSTEGNDEWSGTVPEPNARKTDGPFATLEKAREAIRRLKAQGPLAQPVTVYLRGGIYALSRPLVFTPDDSGSAEYPITYSNSPGEDAVVSGGRRISGWKRMQSGSGGGEEVWTTVVPGVKAGKWYFRQLFLNGQRRQRARTPNEGFLFVEGEISLEKPSRFKFRSQDILARWAKPGDVEVVALQAWAEVRLLINFVDDATRTVTLSGSCPPSNRERDPRYWVENSPDALDAPAEWYLDRRSGVLSYRPLPGESPDKIEVIAPALDQLIRFEGEVEKGQYVHDIRLRGLTLSYTDWSLPATGYADLQAAYDIPAAVRTVGAQSCSIEQCVFKHLGQYAVELGRGSKGNRVVKNEMTDLGAGGVKIGEPKDPNSEEESTTGNLVSDNHIHDIGIVYPAAVGVWVGQSSGNTISHNHIHDTFYTGISVGWTWGYTATAARENVIEFNHIHDIGRGMLSDLGCIYTLGVQPGTVERNNLCHDVTRYERGYGGWGIYTDEGSSNILIENNVVYRAQDGGFHQHYGRENIVRNNIFAFGERAEIRRTRLEPHLSFAFERNVVYSKDGPLLDGKWDDGNFRFDFNLYFRAGGQEIRFGDGSFEDWKKRGQDVHSLIADPLFVDPDRGDFSLKPGSPALSIGFMPIDLSLVGPR